MPSTLWWRQSSSWGKTPERWGILPSFLAHLSKSPYLLSNSWIYLKSTPMAWFSYWKVNKCFWVFFGGKKRRIEPMSHGDTFSLCLCVSWLTIGASHTLYERHVFEWLSPFTHQLAAVWSFTDLLYCEVIIHLSARSTYSLGLYLRYLWHPKLTSSACFVRFVSTWLFESSCDGEQMWASPHIKL